MSCFLAAIAFEFWKWYPLVSWWCLVFICINSLDEHNCFWWSVYIDLWCRFLVMTQYVICGSCGFGVVLCDQKGSIIQVVPYPWISAWVRKYDEIHLLEPIGSIFIVLLHVGFIWFRVGCCVALWKFSGWYGRFETSVVRLHSLVSSLSHAEYIHHSHNCRIIFIWSVVDAICTHLDLDEHPKAILCWWIYIYIYILDLPTIFSVVMESTVPRLVRRYWLCFYVVLIFLNIFFDLLSLDHYHDCAFLVFSWYCCGSWCVENICK